MNTVETEKTTEVIPPYTESGMIEWLKPVEDPELFLSLVSLGLIYGADLSEGGKVHVRMSLTSPMCPAGDYLVGKVRDRCLEHPEVKEATCEVVWEPKWDPHTMASEECKETLGLW